MSEYRDDYPTVPIGEGNPYHKCVSCGVSAPEINGRLEGHHDDCEWLLLQAEESTIDTLQAANEKLTEEVGRGKKLLRESLPILSDVGVEGVSGGWLQLSPLDFKVSKLLKDVEKSLCGIEGQEPPSKKGRPFDPPVCQHNIPISQGCKECARGRQCG